MNSTFQDKNGTPVRSRAFKFFIWSLIVATALYIAYIIVHLLYYYTGYCEYTFADDCYCYINCIPPIIEWPVVNHFRNAILVFMAISVMISMYARKREVIRRDGVKGKEMQDTTHTRTKVHPGWRVFSIILAVVTPVTVGLAVIRADGFIPIFSFGELSSLLRDNLVVYRLIDIIVDINMLFLYAFFVVSLTSLVDSYMTVLDKAFIFGRRVHKSLFGVIWIPIAGSLVIYGDFLDRVIGTFLLLFCAFMIGVDYKDVQNWKFIEDWKKKP
nr:hypothetical protein [Candidatus Sigynarchaeota archaeon]